MSGSARLDGKVALVTGGTRGIGAAISRRLAEDGAKVAVAYAGNASAAKEFATDQRERFPDAHLSVHQANIGIADDCRRLVDEVIDTHGQLDVLVNNAGTNSDRLVIKMSEEDWNSVIAVNLSGTFFTTQAALRHMLPRGTGRIISIGSIVGDIGNMGQANYSASKSGLYGLTKSIAREVAYLMGKKGQLGEGPGLTVNCVSPGVINTEMVQAIPDGIRDALHSEIPIYRFGEPAEVAGTVSYLASDDAAYVTGQVWQVNGGKHM